MNQKGIKEVLKNLEIIKQRRKQYLNFWKVEFTQIIKQYNQKKKRRKKKNKTKKKTKKRRKKKNKTKKKAKTKKKTKN